MLKWTTMLIKMKVSRIECAESLKPLYFCTEVSVCWLFYFIRTDFIATWAQYASVQVANLEFVFILGVISLFLADFQWSCIFANYAKFSCIFNQEVGACCWIRWLTVLYFGSLLLAQKHNTAYAIQSHGIVQVNPPRHANTRRLIFGHSVSTRERRRSRWSNTIPQPWNEAMLQHCAAD